MSDDRITESRPLVLELGGETFRLRKDMGMYATLEKLTGENALDPRGIRINAGNVLALIWAAIDADAAARDVETPITLRRLGTLADTPEKQTEMLRIASELLGLSKKGEAKPPADPRQAAPSRSRSRAATSSAPSTSDSATATTGG